MARQPLAGTMTLTKHARIYDYFDVKLKPTKSARLALAENPERIMRAFLKRKGFKVNSIRIVTRRSKRKGARVQSVRNIDIQGARHAHSGSSKSGWV